MVASRWEFAPELVLSREIEEWEKEIVDNERDFGRGREKMGVEYYLKIE